MPNHKHTDTSHSGDLVKMLYDQADRRHGSIGSLRSLEWQAADHIEELDRHLTLSGKVSKALSERIEVLEAENERLREENARLHNWLNLKYQKGIYGPAARAELERIADE